MAKATVNDPTVGEAQAPAPVASSTSADFQRMKMDTKRLLDAQPKKTVRLKSVSKAPGVKEPNFETVCVNGFIYQIMKGVEVPVPETVYDILDEAGLI